MAPIVFYQAGTTDACNAAARILSERSISFCRHPGPETTDLLLDVPSFLRPGILRSGVSFQELRMQLPGKIRLWGGKLQDISKDFSAVDLLEDPGYLAANAAITADCAIRLAGPTLKTAWYDTKVLVIGWGRIGKQLAKLLRALGASVTVCARKAPDRALLSAFGYATLEPTDLQGDGFQIIFNTAPATVMEEHAVGDCPHVIDLASQPGIPGAGVLHARGLPGIHAPETSGKLIADTLLKLMQEVH